jgi:hypothetical protein
MAVMALGIRRAARIPMMATTISSSMRVKPLTFFNILTSFFERLFSSQPQNILTFDINLVAINVPAL